jgi:hypothetical protein
MHRALASVGRLRAPAVVATLIVHGLLLLLLRLEDVTQTHRPLPERVIANAWIHLQQGPAVVTDDKLASGPGAKAPRQVGAAPAASHEGPTEAANAPSAENPSDPATVDWYGEARQLASRVAEEAPPPTNFGSLLQTAREPCVRRDSSFEWNPEEERRGLRPLPYVLVGDRCVIGLGFLGCALGALPEPNKHLFDDMKRGRSPESSVPHHEVCE